jgi:hypothetical protein
MIPRIAVVLALVLACTGERGAATGESSGDIKTVASTTASSTSTARKDSVRPVAHVPLPDTLRGLYVNRWVALGSKLNRLIEVARTTEINALVIDVKDDRGFVLYRSRVPLAREIGADTADGHWMSATRLRAVLDTMTAHGIYPIARIVVAKDPLLAEKKLDLAIKRKSDLKPWLDKNGKPWLDPHQPAVWQTPRISRARPTISDSAKCSSITCAFRMRSDSSPKRSIRWRTDGCARR